MKEINQQYLQGSYLIHTPIHIQVSKMQNFRVEEPIDQEGSQWETPTLSKLTAKW